MAVSKVAIANSALIKVGGERIDSLTEDSKGARICREQYDKVLEDLLRAHPWNFAIVRATLAASTTEPAFEFTKTYPLPQDCLRVLETDLDDIPWRREGNSIVTDADEIGITYISNDVQAGQFDACFAEVFATKLAHDICYSFQQSSSFKEQLWKEYTQKLREARSFDGQESGSRTVYARQWLNSRN